MLKLWPVLFDGLSHSAGDFLRTIMQIRRQTLYLQVRPAIQLFELNDFLR